MIDPRHIILATDVTKRIPAIYDEGRIAKFGMFYPDVGQSTNHPEKQ